MRICFSRKGFDSTAGKVPSPIVDGVPIVLPIPFDDRSESTYGSLELGDIVTKATKGQLSAESRCHEDPMFHEGRCAFGQRGIAQSHLHNRGMREGDVFLFFGLFAEENGQDWHHRIFGYLLRKSCHSAVIRAKRSNRTAFVGGTRTRSVNGSRTIPSISVEAGRRSERTTVCGFRQRRVRHLDGVFRHGYAEVG